ncbi:uncharacterized protein LOC117585161 [Drosophila guanche]|uniref:Uncharacterized protein n=1 Tax=Drosophila guanche TaxID=7266 RepID=A0A3B0KBJ7_DROGU|nr:uncharacterized protein LOC117585161 [Drosophila guanche]SPP83499.1 Hypothetical predicted protein [Drosophila guanche]
MAVPPALVETCAIDNNSDTWLIWLPVANSKGATLNLNPPRIIAFHFFKNHHRDGLEKWIKLMGKLAQEFYGRIVFGMRDISSIGHLNDNLNPDDFGSYRPGVPPLIFGEDKQHHVYQMNTLVNYRHLKTFCQKLLQNQLFQAVVLMPTINLDSPPQNYFDLEDGMDGDCFVMVYDPACYQWPTQLKMLRKLARLLANENVHVVIINKAHNHLGVVFNKMSKMVTCHGATIFSTPRRNGWDFKVGPRLHSTREYLRYIAQNRHPELIDYNANGESTAAEKALPYIECLFAERN